LEFKPSDFFTGNNSTIIEKFSDDLIKKFKKTQCKVKIYLIGIEDDGTFHPIPRSRLKSDRIESIRENIEDKIDKTVYLIPVIQNENGILILIAGELSNL
jgi:hypothetical protein